MTTHLLVSAVAAVATTGAASAAPVAQFDLEDTNNAIPILTQADFGSVTTAGSGTDDGITLTTSGVAGGRARGLAATSGGVDNDDNAVPDGTFGNLYQDFLFASSSLSFTLTGLAANTAYDITVVSYGSGQGGTTSADWSAGAGTLASTSFQGDLVGPGPDPSTDTIGDYTATFSVTSDGTGALTVTGDSTGGIVVLNGVIVGDVPVPEPGSLALLGLGGLAILRRRRPIDY